MKLKRDSGGEYVSSRLRWMFMLQSIGLLVAIGALGLSLWTNSRLFPAPSPTMPPRPTLVPTRNIYTYFPFLSELPSTYKSRPYITWSEYLDSRAYVEFEGNGSPKLNITDSTYLSQTYALPSMLYWYFQPEFVWSPDGEGNLSPAQRMIWSPDGKYLLFEYYSSMAWSGKAANTWYYSVFSADGTQINEFITIPLSVEAFNLPRVTWLGDSRTLLFPRGLGGKPLFYNVSNRQMASTLDTLDLPYPIFEFTDGKLNIALAKKDSTLIPFIGGANSTGEPSWSPDGEWVAVTWGVGKGEARTVQITWMNKDGTIRRSAGNNLQDVHDVQWYWKDKTSPIYLAYVTSAKEGQRLEAINPRTGNPEFIGEQKAKIAQVVYHRNAEYFSYWWQDTEKNIGISSYQADGIHKATNALPIKVYGLEIFRDPYQWVGTQEIYPSPDGSTFMIRHYEFYGTENKYSTAIIHADGAWSRLLVSSGKNESIAITSPCWANRGTHAYFYVGGYTWNLYQVDITTPERNPMMIPIGDMGVNANARSLPCFNNLLK